MMFHFYGCKLHWWFQSNCFAYTLIYFWMKMMTTCNVILFYVHWIYICIYISDGTIPKFLPISIPTPVSIQCFHVSE